MSYRQRNKRRLELWTKGILIHIPDNCLPDFSCCKPELLAPKEERELFFNLYLKRKHFECEKMLMMFLGRAMSLLTNKKVYIAGGKK